MEGKLMLLLRIAGLSVHIGWKLRVSRVGFRYFRTMGMRLTSYGTISNTSILKFSRIIPYFLG